MNKFQKAGFAVAVASGAAFAAGSLWGADINEFPSLQVRNDNVKACWVANPPDDNYASPCYEKSGGWWFGYTNNESSGEVVKVNLDGSYVNFGSGVSITDADGNSRISNSIDVQVSITAPESENPGGGIGFNYKQFNKSDASDASNRWDGGSKYTDISSKTGYCITYTLTGDAMQFVLGWEEDDSSLGNSRYDVWTAPLKPQSSVTALDLPWSAFTQVGWSAPNKISQNKALQEAVSAKIRYDKSGTGNLKVYQLGWHGECDRTTVPVLQPSSGSRLAMNLAGRSLSLSGLDKAASVQILNLHGAVVASQTLEPSGKMNLSNLPTGIYMVRVPALGYVNKVMLK